MSSHTMAISNDASNLNFTIETSALVFSLPKLKPIPEASGSSSKRFATRSCNPLPLFMSGGTLRCNNPQNATPAELEQQIRRISGQVVAFLDPNSEFTPSTTDEVYSFTSTMKDKRSPDADNIDILRSRCGQHRQQNSQKPSKELNLLFLQYH